MRIVQKKSKMATKKSGFTLMEIMVVVAIVTILATFAIPNIMRSRVAANDSMAISNLKALNSACQLYHLNGDSYPAALADLSATQPPYIDEALGNGQKQGYQFVYASVDADHFTVNANPTHTGLLKGRYFYLDESGIINYRHDAQAGPDDPSVQ